ncbi:MAG: glutamate--tRNA ligase [Candidatus Hodarchaeota archaeon]
MKDELLIEKFTLLNAIKYKGKAELNSTLGAIIQSNPNEFKTRIPEIRSILEKMIKIVNRMTIEEQRSRLLEIDPNSLKEEPKQKKEIKIDLPNLERFKEVVLRLAPYPSGPLHIGNSRMVVLNDYCAKKYKGKLFLVFDDTIGSVTKIIDPEAYDSIPEGLDFLGVKIHKTFYKSDRLSLFYKYAKDIILKKKAYVCTCDGRKWRETYKVSKRNCPCRALSIEENISRWEKMLDGTFPEQGAVVRLITSMEDPDPAIRDPVMLRIAEREHPRVGTKYRVWPLLEFSWGIDDHELGISHIIRGKDLRKEGILEQRIWQIYNWIEPSIILYGRMKLKDIQLSKSRSAKLIRDKIYQNWSDPRTWSLQSLNRRGIQPKAIHEALLNFGISSVDITFSPEHIHSTNRPLIDSNANRFFMVVDPVNIIVNDVPEDIRDSYPLIHPEFPERGTRKINVVREGGKTSLLVPKEDIEEIGLNKVVRLKDLMNIVVKSYDKGDHPAGSATFYSKDVSSARKLQARMIQWVPHHSKIQVKILMPNGNIIEGVAETGLKNAKVGQIIQFERFAFCRIEEIGKTVHLIWTHK